MVEEVINRLQKEFVQFQKDKEKLDTKMEEKMEKLGDRLHNDQFMELTNALEHVNTKIGSIKQFLPRLMEAMTGKKNAEIGELDSVEILPKGMSNTADLGIFS